MAETSEPLDLPESLPLEQRVNLLLVYDQPANLQALEAILQDTGHNLVRAISAEEALQRLTGAMFALIILDVQMRRPDGFEAASRIRRGEVGLPTPILLLTTPQTDRGQVEQAHAQGAMDYIVKPLSPILLRAKVASFVDLFQKTQQVNRQAERLRQLEGPGGEHRLGRENPAVAESEHYFAAFMDHLPGLAWIKDLRGCYVYANDAAAKVFRTPRLALYGKTDDQIFPRATAERFKLNDQCALASARGVLVIETLEHEDGILHHSVVSKFPLPGPDGRPVLVGGMAIDITEQLRAEQAQWAAQEQLRLVTDSMSAPVTRCSRDFTYLWVSKPYADWLGRHPEEIVGRPIREIIGAEAFAFLRPYFERVLAGQKVSYEEEVNFRGPGRRWVNSVYTPTHDSSGQVDGWVAVVLDVDRRKRAEQALKEAARRKDEFLAMLAHELRNPLAPVRNALQIMKMPEANAEIVAQAREMMERQVAHLARLVDDLLNVSRIMWNRIELRKEPVDLATVFAQAVETARPELDARGHSLSVTLPSARLLIEGDLVRLGQVVANLLVNAAKYTDRAGHVWLTGERIAAEAVIRVRDTGMGLDAEVLPRIFDLFTQAGRSLARSQGGLGVGLTVVKRLVELHGGSVSAASPGPGQGSEFVVRLPALPPAPVAETSVPARDVLRPAGSPRRVLVVDDNVDVAQSTAMLLRMLGHQVETVQDGPSALEAVRIFNPEIVLLDIGLPGMTGYTVAQTLRTQHQDRPLVLVAVTGYGQEEDRWQSAQAGFNRHLVKPVDPAALAELVASLERNDTAEKGARQGLDAPADGGGGTSCR
jgi:PAS domain S-box-containing protein